ncbi:hypothetical protein [Paenibacillus agricola]|uniref:Uncharacterized protein n=1 Tax=Paenibacillus agricola TaxID=2716264 RepID=A0ABX0J668_9BACL|nr:hypothetical protein [Paenibacillus agricola]NHN30886.1 hypothetical protein [Paenibacillus agricola]
METWKQNIGNLALQKGILNDPQWLERLDDSMPVWAVLELLLKLSDKLEPETNSYD